MEGRPTTLQSRRLALAQILVLLAVASPVESTLYHWFLKAKVDFGVERIYDITPEGEPVTGAKQGRSAKIAAFKHQFSDVEICLENGQYAKLVGVGINQENQWLEFGIEGCTRTKIRVHFDRPVETADRQPAKLVQYLSAFFDIEGFGTDSLGSALTAALAKPEVDGRNLTLGSLVVDVPPSYESRSGRYGGGVTFRSQVQWSKGRHQWATGIYSRAMTPEEASQGALALAGAKRRDEARLLNARFGKDLNGLRVETGSVAGAAHLSVRYAYTASYFRRDYLFEEGSDSIHYFETSGRKKDREAADAALDALVASARFREAPQGVTVAGLEDSLAQVVKTSSESPAGPAVAETTERTFDPLIEIISASVQPSEPLAGEEIRMIVQYDVLGIPAGTSFRVLEHRELLLDDLVIGEHVEEASRTTGTFTSTRTIRTPPSAQSGFYQFRVRVTIAGVESESSAFFKIRE